jgi:hypothetical protein
VNFSESLGEIARWKFCGGEGVIAGLDLTFITVAGPAMLWDCDLRIRLVVGADLWH